MNPLVRSVSITKFLGIAPGLGIDPLPMCRDVGLDLKDLHTPDWRIPEASVTAILEASAQCAEGASLGLLIGETWRLSDFGVISLLLQHQPTLRQALGTLQHYRHLISDTVLLHLSEHGALAMVEVKLLTGRTQPGRHRVELALGATLSLCRFLLGPDWRPRSVHFAHPAPAQVQFHRRLFGAPLEFGAEFDGLVLDKSDLDRVNPASDPAMARYAQEYIELQPRRGLQSVAHEVRRTVHLLLPRGRNSIEQVSQVLKVSPRTLHRQIAQEGETFLGIVNAVRRELAPAYLESQRHSVSQIAGLLGFAETSAFSRWFSQQFGVAPSRWAPPA